MAVACFDLLAPQNKLIANFDLAVSNNTKNKKVAEKNITSEQQYQGKNNSSLASKKLQWMWQVVK